MESNSIIIVIVIIIMKSPLYQKGQYLFSKHIVNLLLS